MKKFFLATVLGSAVLAGQPASAAGTFDFLDPCIKARSEFSDQRQQVRARYDGIEGSIATMTGGAEFRAAWMKAKKEQARPVFDAEVAPKLGQYGVTDMEKAFNAWFTDVINSIAPADLDDLINTTYRMMAKQELAAYRSTTEAELEKAKADLDASCKKDVGSQALRVALAPLGWIGGNFESAKNEHNVVTQVFKAITGISPKDIAKHGILGGESSELRKLANAAAGGHNSEVRKVLRKIDEVVNPFRWKL